MTIVAKRKVVTYTMSNGRGTVSRCSAHMPNGGYQVDMGAHWGHCGVCSQDAEAVVASMLSLRDALREGGLVGHHQVNAMGGVKSARHAAELLTWTTDAMGYDPDRMRSLPAYPTHRNKWEPILEAITVAREALAQLRGGV